MTIKDPAMEARIAKFLGKPSEPPSEENVDALAQLDAQAEFIKQFKARKLVAESIAEKLVLSLKPKGYYNIPELLDERRLKYAIPNGAFEGVPAFDKVCVWQIPVREGDTFTDGGLIHMPDQTVAYRRNSAPRGVLVSAGLKAMDSLYSTGFELGHIVRFKKFAPFMITVEEIDGHELQMMMIRDGDVEWSEDLGHQLNNRVSKIVNVSESGYDFRIKNNEKISGKKVDSCYDASV